MGVRSFTLLLAAVATLSTVQGDSKWRHCLDAMKGDDATATAAALPPCLRVVKAAEEKEGRKLVLDDRTYNLVAKCVGIAIGVLDKTGRVVKPELERRVRSSSLRQEGKDAILRQLPTCDTWDGCLRRICKL